MRLRGLFRTEADREARYAEAIYFNRIVSVARKLEGAAETYTGGYGHSFDPNPPVVLSRDVLRAPGPMNYATAMATVLVNVSGPRLGRMTRSGRRLDEKRAG